MNILSKILLVIIGAAIVFSGGYFVATKFNPQPAPMTTIINQNPAPASPSPTPTVTPTPPVPSTKKVAAGANGQFFVAYTLTIPTTWTDSRDTSVGDKLTLAKGDYKIVISQAAGGGGGCLYPGDTDQAMAQKFTAFVEINTASGALLRRSTYDNKTFTVCEKRQGAFGFPTEFGYITVTVPASPDSATMAEIDAILASLSK